MKEIIEKSNLDLVFTIGKFMKSLNRELSPIIEKYHFEDTLKLEIALREEIKKGDCILVKGSHSLQLNTLVKNIVGDNYDI